MTGLIMDSFSLKVTTDRVSQTSPGANRDRETESDPTEARRARSGFRAISAAISVEGSSSDILVVTKAVRKAGSHCKIAHTI